MKIVIFALLLLPFAVPANAQAEPAAPTGSRFKQKAEAVDEATTRQIQRDMAECVYRRRSSVSDEFLRKSDYINIDIASMGRSVDALERSLNMERCLGHVTPARMRGVAMFYSLESLRAMLTEAAYVANHNVPPEIGLDAKVFLTNRYFVDTEDAASARIMAGFADCVVHRASVEADALVRTDPATAEENRAIQALVPHLGPCLPSGNELALTPTSIRAIVADGLWARVAYPSEEKSE